MRPAQKWWDQKYTCGFRDTGNAGTFDLQSERIHTPDLRTEESRERKKEMERRKDKEQEEEEKKNVKNKNDLPAIITCMPVTRYRPEEVNGSNNNNDNNEDDNNTGLPLSDIHGHNSEPQKLKRL